MDGIDGSGSMDYAANDIDGLNTIDIAGPGSRALVSFSEYDGLVTSSIAVCVRRSANTELDSGR